MVYLVSLFAPASSGMALLLWYLGASGLQLALRTKRDIGCACRHM